MPPQTLMGRARTAWVALADASVAFPVEGGIDVVTSVGSRLCPAGWVGVVVLGDAGIATVPLPALNTTVAQVFAGLALEAVTDAEQLRSRLPIRQILGPATLAYLDEADFRPGEGQAIVEDLAPRHSDLGELLASVDAQDAGESGLEDITSKIFVIREATGIAAAAGYRHWPGSVAHLSVLTAPEHRGRHLARAVASAAARDALRHRLLPQWRARPAASRKVAHRLGFRDLGAQLSFAVEDLGDQPLVKP